MSARQPGTTPLASLRQDLPLRNPSEVRAVQSDQWQPVTDAARGNPDVILRNRLTLPLQLGREVSPRTGHPGIVGEDHHVSHPLLEVCQALRPPPRLVRPLVERHHRDEGETRSLSDQDVLHAKRQRSLLDVRCRIRVEDHVGRRVHVVWRGVRAAYTSARNRSSSSADSQTGAARSSSRSTGRTFWTHASSSTLEGSQNGYATSSPPSQLMTSISAIASCRIRPVVGSSSASPVTRT